MIWLLITIWEVVDALSRKSSLFPLRALNAHLALNVDGSVLVEGRLNPCFYNKFENCKMMIRNLKHDILSEAHSSTYSVHPGSTKMYCDLTQMYWGPGMKREICEFEAKCLICQQVKAEHQVLLGLLQLVMIPEWKRERVTMDFYSVSSSDGRTIRMSILDFRRHYDVVFLSSRIVGKNIYR
ncbi:integrase [Gossypium australe]|uniref:Integrase n=1 Tax=Gossypium australe TaxID=47621 RepID=A0A5B6WGB9_9ROSI|nr:integrase [Gossypium australe]